VKVPEHTKYFNSYKASLIVSPQASPASSVTTPTTLGLPYAGESLVESPSELLPQKKYAGV